MEGPARHRRCERAAALRATATSLWWLPEGRAADLKIKAEISLSGIFTASTGHATARTEPSTMHRDVQSCIPVLAQLGF